MVPMVKWFNQVRINISRKKFKHMPDDTLPNIWDIKAYFVSPFQEHIIEMLVWYYKEGKTFCDSKCRYSIIAVRGTRYRWVKKKSVDSDGWIYFDIHDIIDWWVFLFNNAICQYGSRYYNQDHGWRMGDSFAPSGANTYASAQEYHGLCRVVED